MSTVPVVVVNWNGVDDTVPCVHALLKQEGVEAEVHVVDNASGNQEADRLQKEFGDRIRLYRSPTNLGFTGGNNLALQEILGGVHDYVALANNDTVPEPSWLATLVTAAEAEPQAGILQGPMVFHDQPAVIENAGILVMTTFDAIPRGRGRPRSEFQEPTELLGACAGGALYRVEMLRQVGLLREDFFANFEDLELSLRAVACGWRCLYVPGAVIRHKLNASIEGARDLDFEVRSLRNVMWACLANLPWQAILLNLPWVVLRDLGVLCLAPFTGRAHLGRALLRSRRRILGELGEIRAARRELAVMRKGSWWRIWWAERNPLQFRPRLLWNLLRGQQRVGVQAAR